MSQYTITFTTDRPVTNLNFWEGQLTGSGTTFTLQSPSYFSGKTAGEYLEHGFQLGYAGNTEPTFTSISFNGVDLCSGSSVSGVSEPVGSTEAPVGSTEGPGETTSGPQESTTAGPAGTSPGTGTGENCEDLIVDKNGWSGNWQVIPIDIAQKNTIRDGGSTASYTAYTIFTVSTFQTVLHSLNSCMYV